MNNQNFNYVRLYNTNSLKEKENVYKITSSCFKVNIYGFVECTKKQNLVGSKVNKIKSLIYFTKERSVGDLTKSNAIIRLYNSKEQYREV